MAKKSTKKESDASKGGDVAVAETPGAKTPAAPGAPGQPGQPTTARRAPGQKEVIPFEWKVCGFAADGYTLTLFKSIEKADSEAQLARLEADGYYYGLKLLKIDDEVAAPPQARKQRADAEKKRAALEAKRLKAEEQAAKKAKKAAATTEVAGVTRVSRKKSLKKKDEEATGKKGATKKGAKATKAKTKAVKKAAKTKVATKKKTAVKKVKKKAVAKAKKKAAPKAKKKTAVTKKAVKKKAAPKKKAGEKPRTASLFKDMDPETVDLATALRLLDLPRVVGDDPESGEPITAQNGRYGPYLKKGTDSRSLDEESQIFDIDLAGALAKFAEPKYGARKAASALKEFDADPVSGKPIKLKDGRFGPYVTDGETNATVPRGEDPMEVDFDRAVQLIADKRAKGPAKKPAKRASAATKKAPAKKATGASKAAPKTAPKKK